MRDLLEFAPLLGAVTGGIGLVAYVVLSYVCSWYYAQLGLTPADVGLDQATLLVRTAVGLAAFVPFAVVAIAFCIAVALSIRWLWGKSRIVAVVTTAIVAAYFTTVFATPYSWMFLVAATGGAALVPFVGPRTLIVLGGVMSIAFTTYLIVDEAHGDAELIAVGQRPVAVYGARPPWDATVVRVHWVDRMAPDQPVLPTCLFYLGESNGTSVFFDYGAENRSLRLPTSMLAIEILPGEDIVAGAGC